MRKLRQKCTSVTNTCTDPAVCAKTDQSAKATIQAEATEALIGALYESLTILDPIENWLTPFWEDKSKEVLADPHKQNYKSALQEWSQSIG